MAAAGRAPLCSGCDYACSCGLAVALAPLSPPARQVISRSHHFSQPRGQPTRRSANTGVTQQRGQRRRRSAKKGVCKATGHWPRGASCKGYCSIEPALLVHSAALCCVDAKIAHKIGPKSCKIIIRGFKDAFAYSQHLWAHAAVRLRDDLLRCIGNNIKKQKMSRAAKSNLKK
jgi:hypothetical protein